MSKEQNGCSHDFWTTKWFLNKKLMLWRTKYVRSGFLNNKMCAIRMISKVQYVCNQDDFWTTKCVQSGWFLNNKMCAVMISELQDGCVVRDIKGEAHLTVIVRLRIWKQKHTEDIRQLVIALYNAATLWLVDCNSVSLCLSLWQPSKPFVYMEEHGEEDNNIQSNWRRQLCH